MYFLFPGSLRSINDSTWLRLQLVYFVSESNEGSNLASLTKEESMETSDMYLFFSVLHVPFFTNTVQTMLKQAINMWVEKVWVYIVVGCYGPKWLWAELTRDFCLLPRCLTLNNFASLSTPMPTECLRPCQ